MSRSPGVRSWIATSRSRLSGKDSKTIIEIANNVPQVISRLTMPKKLLMNHLSFPFVEKPPFHGATRTRGELKLSFTIHHAPADAARPATTGRAAPALSYLLLEPHRSGFPQRPLSECRATSGTSCEETGALIYASHRHPRPGGASLVESTSTHTLFSVRQMRFRKGGSAIAGRAVSP